MGDTVLNESEILVDGAAFHLNAIGGDLDLKLNGVSVVTTATDEDTTYTAGTGLDLDKTTFSADTTYLQRRVIGDCGAGNSIRVINADGTVSCDAIPPVAVPTASDDCDPAPLVNFLGETREDGACPDSYTLRRRWQARDRCGNLSAEAEQALTVSDDTAPVLAGVPADEDVSCDAIPPVASPVGINRDVIAHGETGFLADSDDAWVETLVAIAKDSGARRRMGEAVRKEAIERHSNEVTSPRLSEVLRQVAG